MTSHRRYAALWAAILVLPLTLSACGGSGVPSDAVVKIGPDTIKKTAFDHWLVVMAKQQNPQSGTPAAAALPDAPNFAKCIAQKKKTAKPAKGQTQPTDATYKAQCQTEYRALRNQTMQFLISSAWIEGEAADRGVKISDSNLKKLFDKLRFGAYPQDKDYQAYLKTSGYNQEDLMYQTKVQNLTEALRTKVLAGTDKVSSAQIANYYNKNKRNFATPEKRDIRLVLTKTADKAKQAKSALDSGQSWKAVVSRYSIDQTTRAIGGLVPGIIKGQLDKVLDDAVFSAGKGEVIGPIKTQYGYVTLAVVKNTPSQAQPLKQAEGTIKQQLVSQQQQAKYDAFTKDYQKKWRERTECQKGYAMQSCKNAPKTKPATAAPTGNGSSSAGTTTSK